VGLDRGGDHQPSGVQQRPPGGCGELLRWGWPGAAKQLLREEHGGRDVIPAAPGDRGDGGEAGNGKEMGEDVNLIPSVILQSHPQRL
jgi:hypothetical protein